MNILLSYTPYHLCPSSSWAKCTFNSEALEVPAQVNPSGYAEMIIYHKQVCKNLLAGTEYKNQNQTNN